MTLLGQKKYEEAVSDEHPLNYWQNLISTVIVKSFQSFQILMKCSGKAVYKRRMNPVKFGGI